MEKKQGRPRRRFSRFLLIVLAVVLALPLLLFGISRIGRVNADSVIPGDFSFYLRVPDALQTGLSVLDHQGLDSVLADPALSGAASAFTALKNTGILRNRLFRFAANGTVNAAVYRDERFLCAYDTAALSPLMRFLPMFVSRMEIPDLYYVQAGKLSRFEYRPEGGGPVLYFGPWRNLLLASNDMKMFESVIEGTSRDADKVGDKYRKFSSSKFDAGLLVPAEHLLSLFNDAGKEIGDIISRLDTGGHAEAMLSIEEYQLDIDIRIQLSSALPQLKTILEKNSGVPAVLGVMPSTTQYATIMSLASIRELVDIAVSLGGPQLASTIQRADSSSRLLLGLSVEDLLYSWSGSELAVIGLEGRPHPVFTVKISDENQRKKVFAKLFSSFAFTDDTSVILDGVRIPRIRMPNFLTSILNIWKVRVPAPYYLVENGFLFFSESAENLLETVTAIRRNSLLIKTDVWKQLSAPSPDQSGLGLYYSLDRSIPFFLRGTGTPQRILQLYKQGLARVNMRNGVVHVSLSALSSPETGPVPLPGYPREMGGRPANHVDVITFSQKDGRRILLTLNERSALSIDPASGEQFSFESSDKIQLLPAHGLKTDNSTNAAAWIISSSGVVTLVDGDMNPVNGFPLATGSRFTADPAAFGGMLYLSDTESSLLVLDSSGKTSKLALPFSTVLRSPPTFYTLGRQGYIAMYPRAFNGELWLTDPSGTTREGWPVPLPGIAYGSPLLFSVDRSLRVAFITQAGELAVYDETGNATPGFPVQLKGVFFLQPVFDGTYLWALASDGSVFRIGLDGIPDSRLIPNLTARSGALMTHDIDGDSNPEIFLAGDANLLYGYTSDFSPLNGFPLPVWGTAWFGDLNGDIHIECVAAGMDNRLYAWQFR